MATLTKLGLTAFAGAALYFGFSSPDATDSFAQPAETAIQRLSAKQRVVNGTGMGSLTISGGNVEQDGVAVWVKKAGEAKRIRCLVTVKAVSETQSHAATDCSQPKATGKPIAGIAVKAVTMVVREHVAATIDARDYNIDQVADGMITLVAVNGPVLAASIRPPGD